MKRLIILFAFIALFCSQVINAQQRRPIDNEHPLWMIHIDVWNAADPQKIIDLIPEDIRPYVCFNLSLSCQYDKDRAVYLMPQNAMRTYRSWGTVCQQNGVWFTCQPASGGHTHLQCNDLESFEYMFKRFPNFLGWNFAEQFWGFDEDALFSAKQTDQIALFAKLVEMSHEYGGFLTVSFCGNIWSHGLSPVGMLKRNSQLMAACKKYPEAILWLYKYTQPWLFYNAESLCYGPYIAGLAKNYGVRYDNCGWNGAMDVAVGQNKAKYPIAAGIGTVMEQMAVNGGAVWDAPETIPTESFKESNKSTVDGYTRRNWECFPGFKGAWIDMWRKVLDGTIYIPTREEVIQKTKIVVVNNVTSGSDEQKYASWADLYDGVYKQDDPTNSKEVYGWKNGQMMSNNCYFKKTGRYGAIAIAPLLYDSLAKTIPVQVKKSNYSTRWGTIAKKTADFNAQYPEVSKGDLYVNRFRNQLVTYMPFTYLSSHKTASAEIPLQYNTCETMKLTYSMLNSGTIREYADHIDFYLNNYRTDTTSLATQTIVLTGVKAEPTFTLTKRLLAKGNASGNYDAESKTYTLTVNHRGGIDLSINCQGNVDRSSAGDGLPVATALPLPTQPAPYHGEIVIEAEDMDYKSVKNCVTGPYYSHPNVKGHSGNGFMEMGTNTAGALRHQLTVGEAGDYRITVRYMNTAKAGQLKTTVNGTTKMIDLEKTTNNEWRKVTFDATLKAGKNNLVLSNTKGIAMYIDQIIYTPADCESERFLITIRKANNGTVTADVDEAVEGQTVTLTITPKEGYALKELKVVNGVNFTMGTKISLSTLDAETQTLTFTMPDDIVTLQPVFAKSTPTTQVYSLMLDDVSEGEMPQGWRCVQDGDEVHEYPNTYGLGARTFVGFGGYQGKALYWRNNCAEYGRQSDYSLMLQPGDYKLVWAMAAWKEAPQYQASIVSLTDGSTVATSSTYTATPDAVGERSANLSSAELRELSFTISKAGKYAISFTNQTTDSQYQEFLLLQCDIQKTQQVTGITIVNADGSKQDVFYDLSGRQVTNPQRGIYIKNGKKIFVK